MVARTSSSAKRAEIGQLRHHALASVDADCAMLSRMVDLDGVVIQAAVRIRLRDDFHEATIPVPGRPIFRPMLHANALMVKHVSEWSARARTCIQAAPALDAHQDQPIAITSAICESKRSGSRRCSERRTSPKCAVSIVGTEFHRTTMKGFEINSVPPLCDSVTGHHVSKPLARCCPSLSSLSGLARFDFRDTRASRQISASPALLSSPDS